MNLSINGFYAVYMTGSAGQGFAMLVFRNGTIVGVDVSGVKYDGTYRSSENGFFVKLKVSIPPNTLLIQGVSSGPENDNSELELHLPPDFLEQPFLRISAKHGPVNVKLTRLRALDE
jgi:hypothetical protein